MPKTLPSVVPTWHTQHYEIFTRLSHPDLGECIPGEQEPEPIPHTVSTSFSCFAPIAPACFLAALAEVLLWWWGGAVTERGGEKAVLGTGP